jgi:hypothetical protein
MGSQPEILQILKTDRRVHGAGLVLSSGEEGEAMTTTSWKLQNGDYVA